MTTIRSVPLAQTAHDRFQQFKAAASDSLTGLAHARRPLIAVVDDDEAVRLSTGEFLETAGFRVRSYDSGDDFLSSPTSEGIACIVLDMRMPGTDGLGILLALQERDHSPPVVVVTGHGQVSLAVEAMRMGAQDFMEKPYQADALKAAIDIAITTEARAKGARTIEIDARILLATLAPRQRQVLQGMLEGQQNKVIAYRLGLSIRTIEAYRAQLLTKLGVPGTAGAVRVAMAAGWSAPTAQEY